MKLKTLEKAAALYNRWQNEQNNDTRLPDYAVRDQYIKFCADNGIEQSDAELLSMTSQCYWSYIQEQLNNAAVEAMKNALNAIANKMTAENHPRATDLFELSAKLEA